MTRPDSLYMIESYHFSLQEGLWIPLWPFSFYSILMQKLSKASLLKTDLTWLENPAKVSFGGGNAATVGTSEP